MWLHVSSGSGPPGAGKTSVSSAIEQMGCRAISIGNLAREYCRQDARAKYCQTIRHSQMVGAAESAAVSAKLLKREIKKALHADQDGSCFVVDGFPRSALHLIEWAKENMGKYVAVAGLIGLELDEAAARSRVLSRDGDGRLDDNEAVFTERMK